MIQSFKIQFIVSQKVKPSVTIQPSNSILSHVPKINKNMYSQKLDIIMLIAALFLKTKMWKQPKCPTIDKLISKMYLNVSA